MMLRLGNGEWFECQAEVRFGLAPVDCLFTGAVELRLTGARGVPIAELVLYPHEASQLAERLEGSAQEVGEP